MANTSLSLAYCRAARLFAVNSQLAMAAIRLCKRSAASSLSLPYFGAIADRLMAGADAPNSAA